ncbi:centrosomal protein of 41 kDa-like isoform X2 [Glandiceps talaboti]
MPQNRNSKLQRSTNNKHVITDLRALAEKVQHFKANYRYRQNEIFKRMKVTTFVQLVLQVNAIQKIEDDARLHSIAESVRSEQETPAVSTRPQTESDMRDSPVPSLALTEGDFGDVKDMQTPRSTLQSVIRGIGEFDLEDGIAVEQPVVTAETPRCDPDCPYLLLDIRDKSVFDECHIISALNYPTAMLSRSYNNFSSTPQILNFRNQPGKIIVIYDEDERIGISAATTFAERGFDNVFLLSGGMKVAYAKFREGLITGTVPESCIPQPPSTSKGKKRKPQTAQKIPAYKIMFDGDDLDKLSAALDENLIPQDTGSRLSRASTRASSTASGSTVNTARSTSSIHSSPWK